MLTPPIQLRRKKAAHWVEQNPVLEPGEPGYEKDTQMMKIGDGVTPWNDLQYFAGGGGGGEGGAAAIVGQHINSSLPHPVYDNGPSLTIIYENAKV